MRTQARAARMALIGAFLALSAALASIPFIPPIRLSGAQHPEEDFGKVMGMDAIYTPIAYVLLGMVLAGAISMLVTDRDSPPPLVLLSGVIGALLGGVLTGAASWAYHLVSGAMMRGGTGMYFYIEPFVWDLFIGAAVAVSIGLATRPRSRIRTIVGAGASTVFLSHILHRAMGFFAGMLMAVIAVRTVGQVGSIHRTSDQSGKPPVQLDVDFRPASYPYLIGTFISLGGAMGFCFGLVDLVGKKGWVTVRGKGENATYPITNGARIGSGQFVEVPIKGDKTLAIVHARFEVAHDQFTLVDVGIPTGIQVNGQTVKREKLKDGATIKVGSTELQFSLSQFPVAAYPVLPPTAAPPSPAGAMTPPPSPWLPNPASPARGYGLIDSVGNRINLPLGDLLIGRDPTADVCLHYDQSVSRRHARMAVGQDSVIVEDLGSSNGSTVNRQPLKSPVELNDGDVVTFGSTAFTLRKA